MDSDSLVDNMLCRLRVSLTYICADSNRNRIACVKLLVPDLEQILIKNKKQDIVAIGNTERYVRKVSHRGNKQQ